MSLSQKSTQQLTAKDLKAQIEPQPATELEAKFPPLAKVPTSVTLNRLKAIKDGGIGGIINTDSGSIEVLSVGHIAPYGMVRVVLNPNQSDARVAVTDRIFISEDGLQPADKDGVARILSITPHAKTQFTAFQLAQAPQEELPAPKALPAAETMGKYAGKQRMMMVLRDPESGELFTHRIKVAQVRGSIVPTEQPQDLPDQTVLKGQEQRTLKLLGLEGKKLQPLPGVPENGALPIEGGKVLGKYELVAAIPHETTLPFEERDPYTAEKAAQILSDIKRTDSKQCLIFCQRAGEAPAVFQFRVDEVRGGAGGMTVTGISRALGRTPIEEKANREFVARWTGLAVDEISYPTEDKKFPSIIAVTRDGQANIEGADEGNKGPGAILAIIPVPEPKKPEGGRPNIRD